MRIGIQLVLWLVTFSIPIVVVAYVGYINSKTVSDAFSFLEKDVIPTITAMRESKTLAVQVASATERFAILDQNMSGREDMTAKENAIDDLKTKFQEKFQEYSNMVDSTFPTQASLRDIIKEKWITMNTVSEEMVRLRATGAATQELLQKNRELQDAQLSLLTSVDNALAAQYLTITDKEAIVGISMNNISNATMFGLIGSICLLAAIGLIASRSISKPITSLRNATKEMSKGNFDVKVDPHGIEELKELSVRFNQMQNELKDKKMLTNQFISVASHELKTPIQPILGFALLARKGHISQEEAWDGVLKEARRLQQLANDILDVSRIESGNLIYHIEKVRMNDVILDVVNAIRLSMENSVVLDTRLDADMEIMADRRRLIQVLTNILGNALKFTKKGYVRVETSFLPVENQIQLKIVDTGVGIPDEIMPKLFNKFVTKNIGEENKQGTGLGLFISKSIIDAHNGKIYAYNNEMGGATFVITLPIRVNQEVIQAPEQPKTGKSSRFLL